MKMLLNLTPLDLLIMAEAKMGLYRLFILKEPAGLKAETGFLSTPKNMRDPILDMRSYHNIPVYYSKTFNVTFDMDYWRNKDPVLPKDAMIWFTDGSRNDFGTGSGIYGLKPNKSYSFSLGKYASVFQTEIYAILICYTKIKEGLVKISKFLFSLIAMLHVRHSVARN